MLSRAGVLVVIAVVSGCENAKPPPTTASPRPAAEVSPDARAGVELRLEASSGEQRDRLRKASDLFRASCSPLVAAWSDVESATARQVRVWESSPWAKFGWGEVVQIQVKLKREPLDYRIKALQAGGFTLHYAIGGGKRPGIEAALVPSRKLCDITGPDGWRSLPDAATLGLSAKPSSFSRSKRKR